MILYDLRFVLMQILEPKYEDLNCWHSSNGTSQHSRDLQQPFRAGLIQYYQVQEMQGEGEMKHVISDDDRDREGLGSRIPCMLLKQCFKSHPV